MVDDIPIEDELMAQGNITPICEWLTENVYKHRSKYLPTELIEQITGGSIDTGSYLVYLRSK
jgi:carboxypeptidase Taq